MTIEEERIEGKRKFIKILEDNIDVDIRIGQLIMVILPNFPSVETRHVFYLEDSVLADKAEKFFNES